MAVALGAIGSTFSAEDSTPPSPASASVTLTTGDVPSGAADDQIFFLMHAQTATTGISGGGGGGSGVTQMLSVSWDGFNRYVTRLYRVKRSDWSGTATFFSERNSGQAWVQVTPFLITGSNGTFGTQASNGADLVSISSYAWDLASGHDLFATQGLVVAIRMHGASASLSPAEGFSVDLNRDTTVASAGTRWLSVATRYADYPSSTIIARPSWVATPLPDIGRGLGLAFVAGGTPPPPVASLSGWFRGHPWG